MVYSNPVPAEMVSGSYYNDSGASYYLSPAKLESDYAEVRFRRELKFFRKHCGAGSVLDVGCSSGALLFNLQRSFPGDYQVVGTDVSSAPLDYAESRGVPVIRDNFLTHDFGGRQFDAITFWAVMEHLSSPRTFLDRAGELLKPGGLCFVLVPNLRSLAMRCLGSKYRYIYPQHLNYFSKSTLKRFLETRLSVEEIDSTHFNPMVIWQDFRSGGAEVSNAERAHLLKKTTAYKQSPWLQPVRAFYTITERCLGSLNLADNLVAVARKT